MRDRTGIGSLKISNDKFSKSLQQGIKGTNRRGGDIEDTHNTTHLWFTILFQPANDTGGQRVEASHTNR